MQQLPPHQQQQQVQRFYRQELEQIAQTTDTLRSKHRIHDSGSESDFSDSDGDESRYTTEAANMETHIPESNVGYRLLLKMGWRAGTGLGQNATGRTAPVPIERKYDVLGIGKQEVDRWYTENSTAQRKTLEVEKQAEETEQERLKREAQVEQQRAIQQELETVKSAFYCQLCDKQYERISEYEVHLSSYDHNHKKRFKDMKETSRAGAANITNKIKEKERRREEKELAKMQEAALKRAGGPASSSATSTFAPIVATPLGTGAGSTVSSGFQPVTLSGFQPVKMSGFQPVKLSSSGFQSVSSPVQLAEDTEMVDSTTQPSSTVASGSGASPSSGGFQPVKLGGFQPVKIGGGGFKPVKLGGFQPVDDDDKLMDSSVSTLTTEGSASSAGAPSSSANSETPKIGFQPIKMKIGGFQLKRPGGR
ncbi:G patch domain-containing protein 8 [Gryganskiella cystojenkinii]|nr:G patch domain-containing protein 8 [Gryganskiella cystojenkinii]